MIYDLVFEGGGAKGFVLVGAYEEFIRRGHTPGRVLGTSAGAITAALMAAGYTPEEMVAALNERDAAGKPVMAGFLGEPAPFDRQAVADSAIRKLLKEVNVVPLPDFFEDKADDFIAQHLAQNPTSRHLYAFVERGGWYSADNFLAWLRDKLDAMDGWQHVKVHPTASALETLTHGSKYVRLKGKTPEMMEVVRKHFCDDKRGEPMLGSVDYEKDRDTNADHWVTVIGFQDGDAIVLDPGSGDHKGTRISGATLPPNAKVPTGVLLGDIKSGAGGRYFLVGLEFVNP